MLGIEVMKQHLGQQEIRDRTVLKQFLASQAHNGDIAIDPARISWCAAMMNACERSVGNPGTGLLNARSFLTYGKPVDADHAQEGDIVVFHFPFDDASHGHVTYFVEWDDADNKIKCLGGNQSNMVKYSEYIQDYVVDIRRF